ncbi:hypothetical protein REPUB_Repub06bG0021800 [Reevesia pubescens]
MASSSPYFLLILLSLLSESQTTSKPNKSVLPVYQDNKTNLYVANIYKRTPLLQVPFVVDLNGSTHYCHAQDVLSIQSTQGSNPGPLVRIPQFLFTCAPSLLLQRGLPGNVQGVAGLGNSPISLPSQLASHFGLAGFAQHLPCV